jgi:H+/Cl- antiporter ClcA
MLIFKGNIGGGFATWLVENVIEFPDKTDRHMVVLCAMAAAFGALFPTPVLGVLLIYELGQPPK